MTTATHKCTPAAVERFPYSREAELEWLIAAHDRIADLLDARGERETAQQHIVTSCECCLELNEIYADVPR